MMFKLFNKENKKVEPQPVETNIKKLSNEKDEDLFDDKTVIYSMPEKFRYPHLHANNAKIAGLMILTFGIIFLIGGSFAVYYFLIKEPVAAPKPVENTAGNVKPTSTPPVETAPVEVQPTPVASIPIATPTPPVVLESPATTSSSSTLTPDNLAASSSLISTSSSTLVNSVAAPDQDQDGLSDKEEAILGTDSNKKDSDNDGYDDLSELKKFYNPAGAGKLDDNQNIKVYENENNKYRFYYPSVWKINESSSDTVIVQAPDNSFVQINAEPNKENLSMADWYQAQTKEIYSPDRAFAIGLWQGVRSQNGTLYYIMTPQKDLVYVFNYNPGADNTLHYLNILALVMDSLIKSLGQ